MTGTAEPVLELGRADAETAVRVIAAAFQSEPIFTFACPDPVERARWVPWMARWSVWRAIFCGRLIGDETLSGVAATVGPEGKDLTDAMLDEIGYREGRDEIGTELWDRATNTAVAAFTVAEGELQRTVGEPHWYLDMIGIDPVRQGQGLGGRLIRAVNDRADADSVPTALLTFKLGNLPIYHRAGYDVVCQDQEPESGPPWWGMSRRPFTAWGRLPDSPVN